MENKYLKFDKITDNNYQVRNQEDEFLGDLYYEKGQWIFYPFEGKEGEPIYWTLECHKLLGDFWKELEQYENWIPTSEEIDKLPEPIRDYIHGLETNADPSGMIRENTIAKDIIASLEKEVRNLKGEVDGKINHR